MTEKRMPYNKQELISQYTRKELYDFISKNDSMGYTRVQTAKLLNTSGFILRKVANELGLGISVGKHAKDREE